MNFQEISKKLKKLTDNHQNGIEEEFYGTSTNPHKEFGYVEEVDSHGGEDMGSEYYNVYHFKDHGVYIKVEGWYSSYEGVDYGNWDNSVFEVHPKIKSIISYERI